MEEIRKLLGRKLVGGGNIITRMSETHGLAAHCLPLFFLHRPEATFLFLPFIMSVHRFFLHICLPYSVNNM